MNKNAKVIIGESLMAIGNTMIQAGQAAILASISGATAGASYGVGIAKSLWNKAWPF